MYTEPDMWINRHSSNGRDIGSLMRAFGRYCMCDLRFSMDVYGTQMFPFICHTWYVLPVAVGSSCTCTVDWPVLVLLLLALCSERHMCFYGVSLPGHGVLEGPAIRTAIVTKKNASRPEENLYPFVSRLAQNWLYRRDDIIADAK